jgi:MFS family permease
MGLLPIQAGAAADALPAADPPGQQPPGVAAAQALSTITGVAISPLLGVSAVGAWKYWHSAPAQRVNLPWYAQPWFWIPGLLLVGLVALKDLWGTGLPPVLKKPLDVAEMLENKLSALLVAGLFVPLIASVFRSTPNTAPAAWLAEGHLALWDPSVVVNWLVVPAALVAFGVVWLVGHVVHVLILLSPWGVVDAALKLARLSVMVGLAVVATVAPYAGAALSLVLIVICWCLAGWAFRLMILGWVFAMDLVTLRHRRFKPLATGNRAFLACPVGQTPIRTLGRLRRDPLGQLVLDYRPWLVLPQRTQTLPPGQYVVGRGLLFPELRLIHAASSRTMLWFPPRYRGHEEELARLYELTGVQDVGWLRGLAAVKRWLRQALGWVSQAAAPQPT